MRIHSSQQRKYWLQLVNQPAHTATRSCVLKLERAVLQCVTMLAQQRQLLEAEQPDTELDMVAMLDMLDESNEHVQAVKAAISNKTVCMTCGALAEAAMLVTRNSQH